MKTSQMALLGVAAVGLCAVAVWVQKDSRVATPTVVGRSILPSFTVADVAHLEIKGAKNLSLASTDAGWVVSSLYNYPADGAKIRDELLKLKDLKAGPTALEGAHADITTITLKNADSKALATLEMGGEHRSKPRGEMAQFGGGAYPDGRYVKFANTTVLVNDTLEAFSGDPLKWVDRSICKVSSADIEQVTYAHGKDVLKLTQKDSKWSMAGLSAKEELDSSKSYSIGSGLSYLDLNGVADPQKSEAELGFSPTGAVYTATLKNGTVYTAKIGGTTQSDRWMKVSAAFVAKGTNAVENARLEKGVKDFNARMGKWTFAISSYSAESLSKTRKDLVKAKEDPKKKENKDSATATATTGPIPLGHK